MLRRGVYCRVSCDVTTGIGGGGVLRVGVGKMYRGKWIAKDIARNYGVEGQDRNQWIHSRLR